LAGYLGESFSTTKRLMNFKHVTESTIRPGVRDATLTEHVFAKTLSVLVLSTFVIS
jgi:hypothetical protein